MPISSKQVEHVARLARLHLSPEEVAQFSRELSVILEYIDQLRSVDTEGIELQDRPAGMRPVHREDEVCPSLLREKALASAPDQDGEYFRVPRVIG
ncbi:MAG TPA: Asp-tRNA(Asn)/Glu-tRNA(Gln) amidotransferase subunit GatC [Acidobacteriota bacterium]|nr:Asp-tRNA(Asn)/Glu-tRNA(Gln) amidotransferase subunit GatC [Acidobacteriota bacterium]